ncbi:hypothetical protein DYB37_012521, partial [Aphanomyces astaci]
WLRGKFCSEEQQFASAVVVYTKFPGLKFEKHCATYGSRATFDKLRKVVEKRESRTLRDSYVASVLLSALPKCIVYDVQIIPYIELRDLLPQHWNELIQKYPDFLDAKPTAHAVPVHGYDQAPKTTRSSDFRLSSYDIYGRTTGLSRLRSQRDMLREDRGFCDYCAHALPMAVNTEAATPKVTLVTTTTVIQTTATAKAAISNKATPKAAENELRLRTDAINVTKVRFTTTVI